MVIAMLDAIAPHLHEYFGTEVPLRFTLAPSDVIVVGSEPIEEDCDATRPTVDAVAAPRWLSDHWG
ncbi:hypothetical protein PGTUg99_033693 [Puccinia graminis f. sp. tritici]|uniref:Uncharacterized protein n=1 Tax=Puccinia graminis f. sp. tritici TaxID=56615 RepID=A0A5B0SAS7_PUCGR|nr:hypothetical protein PGTUg99_033693 [Puccinia graminis f. sp. tritici]